VEKLKRFDWSVMN